MRSVCIYTKQISKSKNAADRCFKSASQYNIDLELYPSVWHEDIDSAVKDLNISLKYKPVRSHKTDFVNKTAPCTRIANGITHFQLYKHAAKFDEAVMILEHDAYFIGHPPDPIDDGIIQISCTKNQWNPKSLYECSRANKMKKHEPNRHYNWDWDKNKGIITHPLSGMNATAGYIVGPRAAYKMVEYIKADGVGFADRVRSAHIGEGNLYLQVPQSVMCDHMVASIGAI